MPPVVSSTTAATTGFARHGYARIGLVALFHLLAGGIMVATEPGLVPKAAFLLTWGVLNGVWLVLLRRPAAAAALSFGMMVVLILLSQLKQATLFMTVNFVDLMIIDADTFAFLFAIFPTLSRDVAIAAALVVPLLILAWRIDPFRVRRQPAAAGLAASLTGLVGLGFAQPMDPVNEFYGGEYISKFARSGVMVVSEYVSRGVFEADAEVVGRLKPVVGEVCKPAQKRPHILMIFDESSFDMRMVPDVNLPADYGGHFRSLDGKQRSFIVEGVGGPSWFTEYNVLTGLSVRSYGRFADFVTRIAAGRVERGLPQTLRRCGYKTYSFYPFLGAFLGAQRFQATTGIEHFLDGKALGARGVEPDSFYFDAALKTLEQERGDRPLFLFVYTMANHFPWDYRFRPELTPTWNDLGNGKIVDEYLRRQSMSARDYAALVDRLKRDFPTEQFLIVRFGDHQPSLARDLIDPTLDDSVFARQVAQHDIRFLTTYYAIDAVNFRPADLSSAIDRLDAPYLPLVVLEAAGLSLDPSFAEQKAIMQRCHGQFYRCRDGAEARRFNRLLMDAGLIKGF